MWQCKNISHIFVNFRYTWIIYIYMIIHKYHIYGKIKIKNKMKFQRKTPDRTLWDKDHPKMPSSSFSLDHLLLGMQSTFRVVCFPTDTPSGNSKFSFSSGYQLRCLQCEGWSRCPLLSSSRSLSGAILFIPCSCCLSLCEFICPLIMLI